MFTASMSKREMDEAYGRLTATAVGKDPNLKEVKLCYATVRSYLATICLRFGLYKLGRLGSPRRW